MGVCRPILCSTVLVFTVNKQPLKHSETFPSLRKIRQAWSCLPITAGLALWEATKSLQWERFGYHAAQMAHRMLSSKDMKPNSIPCLVNPDSQPFTWKASLQVTYKDWSCHSDCDITVDVSCVFLIICEGHLHSFTQAGMTVYMMLIHLHKM